MRRPTGSSSCITIRRLAESRLPEMTLAAVRKHELSNGEPVPSLAEALDAAGPHLTVFVEVKALDARHDAALFQTLDAGPAPAHYQVHSFDHRIIRRLHDRRPGVTYGVLSTSYPLDPAAQITQAGAAVLWRKPA